MLNRPIRSVGCLLLLWTFCAATADAQTTQPATTWSAGVKHFSQVVAGKDVKALSAVLSNGPVIRTFASEELQPPERMLGATTDSKIIGVHAYPRVPATLATDMAADFRDNTDIPENVRSNMLPTDEQAEKTANETAAQWVVQALKPAKDQPVAVILLWRQDKTDTYTSKTSHPIFILIKGQVTDDQCTFRQIVYGDPLDAQH